MDLLAPLTAMEREALTLSLRVGLWAVAGGLVPALGVAWILARRRFPGKVLLDGLIHLPLVVPPVVVGYLLLVLLGRNGPLGALLHEWFGVGLAFTWQGAAVAAAIMAFPLMVRTLRLSIEAVERDLEVAARTLGASARGVFLTVTLPLTAPGLVAGALLGFARSLSEFGATITFVSNIPGETRTLPLALFSLTQTPGTEAGALRLCLLAVAVALVAMTAGELTARHLRRRLGREEA